MDRPGVPQVPEGSGEQGKMEKSGCKIIYGAPTTLAVKGLMMMMKVFTLSPTSWDLGPLRLRKQLGVEQTSKNNDTSSCIDCIQFQHHAEGRSQNNKNFLHEIPALSSCRLTCNFKYGGGRTKARIIKVAGNNQTT